MRRILFVDDEERILDGLRRMLRSQRKEWEMVFALGGAAGVAELESSAVDVIVTDMRMPGMDGTQLLLEARRIRPSAVRVVLSGQTDLDLAVKAAGVAHQFIIKPSSSDDVQNIIRRVCCMRDFMPEDDLRDAVGFLRAIPVLRENYDLLRRALDASIVSQHDITRIVRSDPGLAAKVLHLVNSAFFGPPRKISAVADALHLLGHGVLRKVLRCEGVLAPLIAERVGGMSAADFRMRALDRAENPENSMADSNLIHDLGCLIMAGPEWSDSGPDYDTSPTLASRVGAYLLGLWSIPESVRAT